jgi:hypothetical protein
MQRTWVGRPTSDPGLALAGVSVRSPGNGRNEHAQRDRPHRRGAWRRRLQSKSLVLLITKAIDGLLSRSGGGPSMDSRRPVVLYVRTLGGGLSLQLDLAFDFEQRRVVARPLLIRTIVEGLRRIDPRRDSLVERAPARRRFRSRRPHSNSSSINGSPEITTGLAPGFARQSAQLQHPLVSHALRWISLLAFLPQRLPPLFRTWSFRSGQGFSHFISTAIRASPDRQTDYG